MPLKFQGPLVGLFYPILDNSFFNLVYSVQMFFVCLFVSACSFALECEPREITLLQGNFLM